MPALEGGGDSSETEGEFKRWDEIGMRDFGVCGLLSGHAWELACKGAGTAMWESGGFAPTSTDQFPGISLFVLRCVFVFDPVLTDSKNGVRPRYHAVGVNGVTPADGSKGSRKAGFGLGMIPSEPRRRIVDEVPYPGICGLVSIRSGSPRVGRRGIASEEAKLLE